MATSITCDMCGGEPAVVMVTNLGNGDTLAYGEACQLTFHLTVATSLAETLTADVAGQYAEMVNRLVVVLTKPESPTTEDQVHDVIGTDSDISEPPAFDEGPADEHTTTAPGHLDGDGNPAPAEHGHAHQPRGRGPRRPG